MEVRNCKWEIGPKKQAEICPLETLYISLGTGASHIYCTGYTILGNVNVEKKWKNGLKTILWLRGKSFIEKGQIQDVIYIINYVSQLSVLNTGLNSTLLTLIRGIIEATKNLGKSWLSQVVTKPNLCSANCCFELKLLLVQYSQTCSIATEVISTLITTNITFDYLTGIIYATLQYQKSTGRSDRFLKVLLARSELT